jgi:hypothetical protein
MSQHTGIISLSGSRWLGLREEPVTVAGELFTEQLVEPTNGVWGRQPGEKGKVADFITGGGATAPPCDGGFDLR